MVFTQEEALLVKTALVAGLVELKAQGNNEALDKVEQFLIESNELNGIEYVEKLIEILEYINREIGGDVVDR